MYSPASILRPPFFATVGLTALFLASAWPARADEKPPAAGGFFGTFEGHYLDNIGETTRWGDLLEPLPARAVSVSPEWGGGGRVGLGYHATAGWDVVALGDADWLYSPQRDVHFSGSGALIQTLHLPPGPGVSSDDAMRNVLLNGQAEATAQTAYSYVDLEAGYNIKFGESVDARIFGGVRYANFDQNIEVSGVGSFLPNTVQVDDSTREVGFWGVGPRVGGSGRLRVCGSPFYLVASTSGAVLIGNMKVKDRQSVTVGSNLNAGAAEQTSTTGRTAFNAEGELGILYDISPILQGLDVTVGYRLSGWFGVNDTRSTTGAILINPFNTTTGESHANVVTQGTFLRLNVRY